MSETTDRARALLAEVAANGFAEGSALELLATLIAEADASERRAVEAEAGAAVLREALTRLVGVITTDPEAHSYNCIRSNDPCECWASDVLDDCGVAAALTNPAGRAILGRLERAEAERDAYHAKAENAYAAQLAAESERDALRAIISECATAIGNGAAVSKHASVEFMAMLPGEIRGVATALRAERAALRADLEKERAKVRTANLCDCARPYAAEHCGCNLGWFEIITTHNCPTCSGSGAVIVEGEA